MACIVWFIGAVGLVLAINWAYDGWLALASMLFAAICIGAVCAAPRRLGLLSWGIGIPAFYMMFFVLLPLINRAIGASTEATDNEIAVALGVASVGLVAYAAGVSLMRATPGPRPTYDMLGLLKIDVSVKPIVFVVLASIGTGALVWSYMFGYFGLIGTTGTEVGKAAGVVFGLGFLLTIAHVLAWNRFFATHNRRVLVLGVLSTIVMLAFGLIANSKGQMLAPFFFIALCLWGVSGKFPFKLFLVSLLFYVFIAFPFVTASRFAFKAEEFAGSRDQLAELMVDYLASKEWLGDAETFLAVESLGRGLLPYFARVVQQSGTAVEFMQGKTFIQGLEVLVPRLLYPEKPDMNIGNWTAKAFGAVDPSDDVTNFSPTFIGEFYMNFGVTGVFVGMFLMGILATLVDRYLIIDKRSWTMPIMVSFVGWQESVVGHTIILFIKNAALWVPILLVIAYLTRSPTTARRQSMTLQGRARGVN